MMKLAPPCRDSVHKKKLLKKNLHLFAGPNIFHNKKLSHKDNKDL